MRAATLDIGDTHPPRTARLVVATSVGSALEFFDYTAYSFFAIVIGKLFFPSLSPYMQLLLSVVTYGMGYVIRPLGGLIFGSMADRRGRKSAMMATVLLMALGCAVIGLAPTYATAGSMAPLFIIVGRVLQGISAGGEVGAGTTILAEAAAPARRGLFGSLTFASQGLGVTLGALLAVLINRTLSPEQIAQWGWRVPFLLGVLIAFVALFLRSSARELDIGAAPAPPAQAVRRPADHRILSALRDHIGKLCFGTLLVIGSTVCANIVTFYMPTYAISVLHMAPANALTAAMTSGAVVFVGSILAGWLSDRHGRKTVILYSRLALVIVLYPAFRWLGEAPTPSNLILAVAFLSALSALTTAPSITMIPEMFPARIRASGVSIVYSVGVSVFGGFAQASAVWLIHVTGSNLAPAYYTIACILVSTVALLFVKDQTGRPI
ncbi:MFS transporter [Chitinasiproducens palmae]|uniref:Predicted arabinose efflux permease, MFS family n=1 Tax=Chitinasiproducens palmae TaxID=1770053 RepID=A0A1H2PJV9_9BURK|nr:MFS transporter [Chitinasiproducens palmae]SDV46201.1 Predicted arabinose efflux permease, MFS family [Chitinasiproducens palmae]